MKKNYTYPVMDISVFDKNDVISTSGIEGQSVDPSAVSSSANALATVTLSDLNILF